MFDNAALVNEIEPLRKFACRLTGNSVDAEDLVQATVLRAIEKKHLFREGTNICAWASKIMFNIFVSQYRRKSRFESQYDPEIHIQNQKVAASQETQAELAAVNDAMQSLSADHRQILMMVCVQDMAYAEVAEKLDIPMGTVRSRLSRARESLETIMEEKASHMRHAHIASIAQSQRSSLGSMRA